MERIMRYVSIDIETLGLDFSCGIIEFGAVIDDLNNPLNLEELPKFHTYLNQDKYLGEPFAMSMHSNILKRIAAREEGFNYIYPSELGVNFKKFLIDNNFEEKNNKVTINIAGKNFMSFDNRFLENHTTLNKYVNFRSRVLDPAILYYEKGDNFLPSLQECLNRAEIDSEVRHTAIEDCLDVIKLIRKKMI
jgi:hypothetical protein